MSFTDNADDVQPDAGQGDGGSDAPYAEYLNRIPEELRGDVEPVFKEWDSSVTKRFQDHSNFRKQWEPYQETGVDQYEPEAVQWALSVLDAAQNRPNDVVEWARQFAQENGIELTPAQAQEAAESFEEFGAYDPAAQQKQLEETFSNRLAPLQQRLDAFEQFIQQQGETAEAQRIGTVIDNAIASVEQKHGISLKEGSPEAELVQLLVEKQIDALNGKNITDQQIQEAVEQGFLGWKKMVSGIEQGALNPKVDAPAPAESGGVPDISVPTSSRIDSDDVRNAAMEFLRNNRRANA